MMGGNLNKGDPPFSVDGNPEQAPGAPGGRAD